MTAEPALAAPVLEGEIADILSRLPTNLPETDGEPFGIRLAPDGDEPAD
jgi:hypothetical protein